MARTGLRVPAGGVEIPLDGTTVLRHLPDEPSAAAGIPVMRPLVPDPEAGAGTLQPVPAPP